MLKQFLVVACPLLLAGNLTAEDDGWEMITVIPKQEAAKDSSLVAFLDSLESAVAEKDSVFIFEHLHENIKVSFGYPPQGIKSFVEYWKPFDQNSRLWPNMLCSIRRGGGWSNTVWVSLNDSSFQMPYRIDPRDYLCTKRLEDGSVIPMKFDQEEGGAYVADTLRVLHVKDDKHVRGPEKPWQGQPSPDLVRKFDLPEDGSLISAYLPDQRRGYVPCDDITSPANGCQLYFIKTGNKWRMICCMGEYSDLDLGR